MILLTIKKTNSKHVIRHRVCTPNDFTESCIFVLAFGQVLDMVSCLFVQNIIIILSLLNIQNIIITLGLLNIQNIKITLVFFNVQNIIITLSLINTQNELTLSLLVLH